MDIPVPIDMLYAVRHDNLIGISDRRKNFTSAYEVERRGFDKLFTLTRILPSNWNYFGQDETWHSFSAGTESEAIGMQLRVRPTAIEPVSLYPAVVSLQEFEKKQKNKMKKVREAEYSGLKPIELETKTTPYSPPSVRGKLQSATDEPSFNLAQQFLASVAHQEVGSLLQRLGVPILMQEEVHRRKDGRAVYRITASDKASSDAIPYVPWFASPKGHELATRVSLQQIASVVSDAPMLSVRKLSEIADEINDSYTQSGFRERERKNKKRNWRAA